MAQLNVRNIVNVGQSMDTNELIIDSQLSTTSKNPVENKVITQALMGKQDALSVSQLSAVNSGINTSKRASYDNHIADEDIHVTSAQKTAWSNKQDKLNAFTGADGVNAGAAGIVPAPAATDNAKYLKGDGTWADVDGLPSQTGNSGKFLTTDGSSASWATVSGGGQELLAGENISLSNAYAYDTIASNFCSQGYIRTTSSFTYGQTTILKTKFKHGRGSYESSSSTRFIMYVWGAWFAIGTVGGDNKFKYRYKSSGSDVFSTIDGYSLNVNGIYYLKCTLTANSIQVDISTDDISYTNISSLSATVDIPSTPGPLVLGSVPWDNEFYGGQIYLNETKVYVDNTLVCEINGPDDYTIQGNDSYGYPSVQRVATNVAIPDKQQINFDMRTIPGFDRLKTQTLKNVYGTLKWVDN